MVNRRVLAHRLFTGISASSRLSDRGVVGPWLAGLPLVRSEQFRYVHSDVNYGAPAKSKGLLLRAIALGRSRQVAPTDSWQKISLTTWTASHRMARPRWREQRLNHRSGMINWLTTTRHPQTNVAITFQTHDPATQSSSELSVGRRAQGPLQ